MNMGEQSVSGLGLLSVAGFWLREFHLIGHSPASMPKGLRGVVSGKEECRYFFILPGVACGEMNRISEDSSLQTVKLSSARGIMDMSNQLWMSP